MFQGSEISYTITSHSKVFMRVFTVHNLQLLFSLRPWLLGDLSRISIAVLFMSRLA